MNRPIVRLYGLVALLFALLVAFTSRWTVFEASSLRENRLNARRLLEQERIDRGPILAADGTVLARSVRGTEGIYQRIYPTGEEFAHAVGYSYISPDLGQSGIERFRNDALNGEAGTNLQTILDQLQGRKPQGDEVVTTLDPAAQRVAISALDGHQGAVVALDPRTGAVKVMASTPGFDPNALRSPRAYGVLTRDATGQTARQPRHPVRLCAGLDLQGGDRDGRHRYRDLHPRIDAERARQRADLRCPLAERRQREPWLDNPHRGAGQIG